MKANKLFLILALVPAGFWLTAGRPGDVMADLSIETGKLRQDVLLNLKGNNTFFFHTNNPIRQMARQIPEASRVTTVRTLGKAVRMYIESATFQQEWLQDLRSYYPYDDTYSEENVARQQEKKEAEKAAFNQQKAAVEQSFAMMDANMLKMAIQARLPEEEKQLSSMTGEEKAAHARYMADVKRMLALPPAEFKKKYIASMMQQAEGNLSRGQAVDPAYVEQQQRQKAAFDSHANFQPLLKQRLKDFITLCKTVDFNAQLMSRGSRQEFVNPQYQSKPAEWKFLYRLGQGPVTEAQVFAQQWLADLH